MALMCTSKASSLTLIHPRPAGLVGVPVSPVIKVAAGADSQCSQASVMGQWALCRAIQAYFTGFYDSDDADLAACS